MSHSALPTFSRVKFLTPGTAILLLMAGLGVAFGIYRFAFGLQASTNMNQVYPWGIWIVADVSFIALAAGGFVTAGLVYVLNRQDYHFLVRPALLTALLGYTCACILLAADLGRYYNIWHPLLPSMWQGNSALFEVGMCVMCYLSVLYLEFVPVVCERFRFDVRHPWLGVICGSLYQLLEPVMIGVVILGIAISCLHQSSLGHVMVLAGPKLHPLWWTPILSLLFVMSAVVAAIPTVMFVCLWSSTSLGLRPPMRQLSRLASYLPVVLGVYLAFKIGDLLVRGSFAELRHFSLVSAAFGLEVGVGLVVPLVMLMSSRVLRSPRALGAACLMVMFGVVLYRTNVYWLGFRPFMAPYRYFPSLAEWGFTIGVLAGLIVLWRFLAMNLAIVDFVPECGRSVVDAPRRIEKGAVRHGA
ncbi:MAG: Ni/Fe-hydrogenase cytochrome b subunit [Phycisphaerae bacterium]|nr:Ni/Fe-hydrogenase cytochrome b subunit [Phycisphaerae bacterium]